MHFSSRPASLLAALCLALLLPACGPLSVTFTLGARDGKLREATVMDDGGKGSSAAKIALIDVRGVIAETSPTRALGLLDAGPSPVDEFVARLKKAAEDDSVRAVILRINSPGGSVAASELMYNELRRFRESTGKPVVASLSEVAASGGYYLALGADEIVAQPTSITASIGVIIPTINVSEGLRRIGVVSRSVKSGQNKDIANPLEPMRDSQYAVLQSMVDEFYASFRALVVERRTIAPNALDTARLDELTDGRVVTGAQAVRTGLADREGDLRDAFERAKALAGVERARLVKFYGEYDPPPRTAYATAGPHAIPSGAGPSGAIEINLLRIDGLTDLGGPSGAVAYYLWLPQVP